MTLRNQVLTLVVFTATGVAVGRYTVPVKVVTETKVVEVEKKSEKIDTNTKKKTKKETVIVDVKKPDGTVETTTKITEESGVDRDTSSSSKSDIAKTDEDRKEIIKESGHLSISALAGINPFSPQNGMVYGGHVHRDILGPISCGLWGLSDGVFGASVGLTF